MQGAADHGVSEALYLADEDGNGIEIYRDRPREQWPIVDGQLRMGADPMDLDALLAEAGRADSAAGLPRRHASSATSTCTCRGWRRRMPSTSACSASS